VKRKKFWITFFLVLFGIVLGALVSHLTSGVPGLSWLSFGQTFGLASPVTLDLGIITLTFGISFDITISVILFIAVTVTVGRFITRKW